nr:class I SAM-dependent methyltransferase [Janibacter alkaliphilus]
MERQPNGTLATELHGLTPGRALDVGAGEGADAIWLAEHGWEVTANDISGNALAQLANEAARRHLPIQVVRSDINEPSPFAAQTYDLVSLQYGSFTRTPDDRGLRNLLDAVAPGGTLLAVHHDLAAMREPVDVTTTTRLYDPDAYVGVDAIAAALRTDPQT